MAEKQTITGRLLRRAAPIAVGIMLATAIDVAPAAETTTVVTTARERTVNTTSSASIMQRALQGSASAQAQLGFLYATGRGVPQNLGEAAYWYSRAAEQGDDRAQYLLGLAYDKGHGVPRDYVVAHKWLNLSASRGRGDVREHRVRVRDAIASKLTFGQLAEAEQLALQWRPARERAAWRR